MLMDDGSYCHEGTKTQPQALVLGSVAKRRCRASVAGSFFAAILAFGLLSVMSPMVASRRHVPSAMVASLSWIKLPEGRAVLVWRHLDVKQCSRMRGLDGWVIEEKIAAVQGELCACASHRERIS